MERALLELVWRRAGNCCEYCRMPREYDDTTRIKLDHRVAYRQELIEEGVFPPA